MKYILLFLLILTGCTTIKYKSPKGEKFEYKRSVFSQQIDGLSVEKDPETGVVELKMANQKSDLGQLIEVLNKALGMMETAAK